MPLTGEKHRKGGAGTPRPHNDRVIHGAAPTGRHAASRRLASMPRYCQGLSICPCRSVRGSPLIPGVYETSPWRRSQRPHAGLAQRGPAIATRCRRATTQESRTANCSTPQVGQTVNSRGFVPSAASLEPSCATYGTHPIARTVIPSFENRSRQPRHTASDSPHGMMRGYQTRSRRIPRGAILKRLIGRRVRMRSRTSQIPT